MAKIENSMLLLATLEHSNREDKVLHKNKHENGLTFWGIYESMHPDCGAVIKLSKRDA